MERRAEELKEEMLEAQWQPEDIAAAMASPLWNLVAEDVVQDSE